jgi:hypothetical protein
VYLKLLVVLCIGLVSAAGCVCFSLMHHNRHLVVRPEIRGDHLVFALDSDERLITVDIISRRTGNAVWTLSRRSAENPPGMSSLAYGEVPLGYAEPVPARPLEMCDVYMLWMYTPCCRAKQCFALVPNEARIDLHVEESCGGVKREDFQKKIDILCSNLALGSSTTDQ